MSVLSLEIALEVLQLLLLQFLVVKV